MKQIDALRNRLIHLGRIPVRKRGQFSYEASSSELDIIEQINKLREMKKSPYWKRSFADVAGMLLLEYVSKEIDKYESPKS